ncbi:hypothetical protein BDZ85DRAFT_273365 [Elsinoe ampelina]|uniref:holo-[acyl-carrier-protein] synthase n=1 Tax=Elsinoe ampelina TaxID=302913 RepID=A0A6A6GEM7_9PEZI|nr:hypothetical protein BDZ85DRAFT_273365 [Elsinoe ampelina]
MTSPPHPGKLTLWLLDTRSLWPGSSIKTAAPHPLSLLPTADQVPILRKHHITDARMSLASALLKRLYTSQVLCIPFPTTAIARRHNPQHGKPAALLPSGAFANFDFNVSHQAGLVTLIGYAPADAGAALARGRDPAVLVGTDVTLPGERDDYRAVDAEGVDGFVDVFAEVFSDAERFDMAFSVDYVTLLDGRVVEGRDLGRADRVVRRGEEVVVRVLDGRGGEEVVRFDSELVTEAKLRRFYAFFAYKEAYIKLAGEALLAGWLKELEFRGVRSPRPGAPARCAMEGMWGGREEGVEVWLKGERVRDTQMDLRAYDEGFIIASAIKGDADVKLKDYDIKVLHIDEVLESIKMHM